MRAAAAAAAAALAVATATAAGAATVAELLLAEAPAYAAVIANAKSELALDQVTVIAPTQGAAENDSRLPFLTVDDAFAAELARQLVDYHTLNGVRSLASLKSSTAEGLTFNHEGTQVNNLASIVAANDDAANGVVHWVDTVLFPWGFPSNTIWDITTSHFKHVTALSVAATDGAARAMFDEPYASFTAFAATDEGWEVTLGSFEVSQETLTSDSELKGLLNELLLSQLVKHHVLNSTQLATLGADALELESDRAFHAGNFVANVISPDHHAINGIVHFVSKPYVPSSLEHKIKARVAELKDSNTAYDEVSARTPGFADLVRRAGRVGELAGPSSKLTLLAPTHDIGEDDFYPFYMLEGDYMRTVVRDLVDNHIIAGTSYSHDQLRGTTRKTAFGADLEFTADGKFINEVDGPRFEEVDNVVDNGVLHFVDELLFPPGSPERTVFEHGIGQGYGAIYSIVTKFDQYFADHFDGAVALLTPFTVKDDGIARFYEKFAMTEELIVGDAYLSEVVLNVTRSNILMGEGVSLEQLRLSADREFVTVSGQPLKYRDIENLIVESESNVRCLNGIAHVLRDLYISPLMDTLLRNAVAAATSKTVWRRAEQASPLFAELATIGGEAVALNTDPSLTLLLPSEVAMKDFKLLDYLRFECSYTRRIAKRLTQAHMIEASYSARQLRKLEVESKAGTRLAFDKRAATVNGTRLGRAVVAENGMTVDLAGMLPVPDTPTQTLYELGMQTGYDFQLDMATQVWEFFPHLYSVPTFVFTLLSVKNEDYIAFFEGLGITPELMLADPVLSNLHASILSQNSLFGDGFTVEELNVLGDTLLQTRLDLIPASAIVPLIVKSDSNALCVNGILHRLSAPYVAPPVMAQIRARVSLIKSSSALGVLMQQESPLVAVAKAAGLESELIRLESPRTFLAPTEDALKSTIGYYLLDSDYSRDLAREFLQAHILDSQFSIDDLSGLTVRTTLGNALTFSSDGKRINNGASVIQGDVTAGSTTVHWVDSVLVPTDFPQLTIYNYSSGYKTQFALSSTTLPAFRELLDQPVEAFTVFMIPDAGWTRLFDSYSADQEVFLQDPELKELLRTICGSLWVTGEGHTLNQLRGLGDEIVSSSFGSAKASDFAALVVKPNARCINGLVHELSDVYVAAEVHAAIQARLVAMQKDASLPLFSIFNTIARHSLTGEFAKLVKLGGLHTQLSSRRYVQVLFAPSDTAIFSETTVVPFLTGRSRYAKSILADVINYHCVPLEWKLPPGSSNLVTALVGARLQVDANGVINPATDAAHMIGDGVIETENGGIYIIDKILLPPSLTIAPLSTAVNAPSTRMFFSILETLGLKDRLAGVSEFTVFAPTNKAIHLLIDPIGLSLDDMLKDLRFFGVLEGIAKYHVVQGKAYDRDEFIRAKSVKTLGGGIKPAMSFAETMKNEPVRALNGILHQTSRMFVTNKLWLQLLDLA